MTVAVIVHTDVIAVGISSLNPNSIAVVEDALPAIDFRIADDLKVITDFEMVIEADPALVPLVLAPMMLSAPPSNVR